MAHRWAYGDAATYWRMAVGDGEDAVGRALAEIAPKLESPEAIANRERVTRNLQGKA